MAGGISQPAQSTSTASRYAADDLIRRTSTSAVGGSLPQVIPHSTGTSDGTSPASTSCSSVPLGADQPTHHSTVGSARSRDASLAQPTSTERIEVTHASSGPAL